MKKIVVLMMIITFCCSCNKENNSVSTETQENIQIQNINCNEALEKNLKGAFLIDVRSKEEYDKGSLSGALNIPVGVIQDNIGKYVKDKESDIIVFCQSGNRSKQAATILKDLGYKNIFDLGSINNCK
ncbi:MAG: rhodanese-like domain-containing protein [Bacilli bacterium]